MALNETIQTIQTSGLKIAIDYLTPKNIIIGVVLLGIIYFLFIHQHIILHFKKKKEKAKIKMKEKEIDLVENPFLKTDIDEEYEILMQPKSRIERLKELHTKLTEEKKHAYQRAILLCKQYDDIRKNYQEEKNKIAEITKKIEQITTELEKEEFEKVC